MSKKWKENSETYKSYDDYADPKGAHALSTALSSFRTDDRPLPEIVAFMGYVYSDEMAAIRAKTQGE
jgi:hypothetical protein